MSKESVEQAAGKLYPKPKPAIIPDDYYNEDFCKKTMEMELFQSIFIKGAKWQASPPQPEIYPGKKYQRLFDAIGKPALQSEMDEIIQIVHEDFPPAPQVNKAERTYTEHEVKMLTAMAIGHARGDTDCKKMWSDWWAENKKPSPPDAGKEQDAVDDKFEFAEWCENNYWGDGNGLWKKSIAEDEAEEFTTQQLYTLYKQNNQNE